MKIRALFLIVLSIFGCVLSLPSHAQTSISISNQSHIYHVGHWSLQSQPQNDDDDIRERREEEIVSDTRPVRLGRPQ